VPGDEAEELDHPELRAEQFEQGGDTEALDGVLDARRPTMVGEAALNSAVSRRDSSSFGTRAIAGSARQGKSMTSWLSRRP
jgi:hypothetical protein